MTTAQMTTKAQATMKKERKVLQIPNQLFFSALKTRFSASEIYVGIIHAENLFDIWVFQHEIYVGIIHAENPILSAEKKQLIWNL